MKRRRHTSEQIIRKLWGAVTPTAAVFRVAPDRHEREAVALLGEDFEGIVGSDRWWAYRGLLSASATCRLQGRSLFAYLADVRGARVRGDPTPLPA